MRISDWSSDVCSSDLKPRSLHRRKRQIRAAAECRGPADDAAARPRGREIARHVGPAEWDTPEMVTFFRQHLSRDSGALRPHDATKRAAIQMTRTVAPFLASSAFRITNQLESSS